MAAMTLLEFRSVHAEGKKSRPKLFQSPPPEVQVLQPERPSTTEQVKHVEQFIGLKLPQSLVEFLTEFGGGYFGRFEVVSANPISAFFLPNLQEDASALLPDNGVAISDDHCGGWFFLKPSGDTLGEEIWYWNADGGAVRTEYNNIFELVARFAY